MDELPKKRLFYLFRMLWKEQWSHHILKMNNAIYSCFEHEMFSSIRWEFIGQNFTLGIQEPLKTNKWNNNNNKCWFFYFTHKSPQKSTSLAKTSLAISFLLSETQHATGLLPLNWLLLYLYLFSPKMVTEAEWELNWALIGFPHPEPIFWAHCIHK